MGEYDVKSLISSIDEQQTEEERQVESLFFDRRQRVSESAYKLARQSGVVPQYDPVCIYTWE